MKKFKVIGLLFLVMFFIGCSKARLYDASTQQKKDTDYVLKQIEQYPSDFQYADEIVRNNKEIAFVAVRKYGWNLAEVGEVLRDDTSLVFLALKNSRFDMRVFQYASQRLKSDREFVKNAMKINGDTLLYANEKFKNDKKLVLLALKNSGPDLFLALPKVLKKDRDVAMLAMKKHNGTRNIYAQIGTKLQSDKSFILPLLKEGNINIYHLHKKLYEDRELMQWAIKKDGSYLQYASTELKKDKELVRLAIKKHKSHFKYADKILYSDEELLLEVIGYNSKFFKDIDLKLLKKRSFVLKVIKKSCQVLKYVDSNLKKDRTFVMDTLNIRGTCLQYFDKAFQDEKAIVLKALAHKGNFSGLNKVLQLDKEVVKEALTFNGNHLQFVTENFKKDKSLVLLAVKSRGISLKYASDKLKSDKEIVLHALSNDGKSFEYVDNSLKRDKEVVSLAIEKYFYNIYDKKIDKTIFNQRDVIKKAIKVDATALRYASSELKKDKVFILPLLEKSPLIYQFISNNLKRDRDITLKALGSSRKILKYVPLILKKDKEVLALLSKNLKKGEENWLDFSEAYKVEDYHLHKDARDYDYNRLPDVHNRSPKGILTLLDGIDTEAELSMFLSMFDKFNIRGNYQYIKTATGYKVKKIEFEYPKGDTIPRNTYILDISQNGNMQKKLINQYIQVYPKI